MKDFIVSGKTGETYAVVELRKDKNIEFFYEGDILEYQFPAILADLIDEHDELISGFSIALLDEVEEKIYEYELRLKLSNTKIFSPCIKEKKLITFFTKYPTSRGFVDDYPA